MTEFALVPLYMLIIMGDYNAPPSRRYFAESECRNIALRISAQRRNRVVCIEWRQAEIIEYYKGEIDIGMILQ